MTGDGSDVVGITQRELDDLRRWRDGADGAMVLARWALGASLISLTAVVLQVVAAIAKAMDPSLP